MKTVAFIGSGNMGGALIRAACRALGPGEVVIADACPERAAALAAELGCTAAEDNGAAADQARCCFLCVKPQVLHTVAADLADHLRGKTVVSIAAGVQIATIKGYLGSAAEAVTLLRVMPNTCAAIGQGMLALTGGAEVPEEAFRLVEDILRCAGRVERLSEGLMDQFTAVAGCGPAFVYPFIEALADGGVMAGLPRAQAQTWAAQTVLGAAAMVLETGKHPGVLKDEVCSPGGSTIAGVAALERHAFRSAAIEAVLDAWAKNVELGKPREG